MRKAFDTCSFTPSSVLPTVNGHTGSCIRFFFYFLHRLLKVIEILLKLSNGHTYFWALNERCCLIYSLILELVFVMKLDIRHFTSPNPMYVKAEVVKLPVVR